MKESYYNDAKRIKYVERLSSGKPKRNAYGEITKHAPFQNPRAETARIQPLKNWFTGTKVVTQEELEEYRSSVRIESPYNVLLRTGKVPYSLLEENVRKMKSHDFESVFGKKATRKKPKLSYGSLEELSRRAAQPVEARESEARKEEYVKGQSHRIWVELYKVIDSSDVVVHVLDARDPLGTKCDMVTKYLKEEAPHKHLIYILNKVDLVPTAVTAKWMRFFSRTNSTIAFHSSSITHNYGKSSLLGMLKQLSKLYKKLNLCVGFVGYPNTGKSSIINALRNKKVCNVAPIPGETKVWQYITLTRGIYLIDCPGIVPVGDYEQGVLRGAVRVESIKEPEVLAEAVVNKAPASVTKAYGIGFADFEDLVERLARRYGRLVKGGEPDIDAVSRMIIRDWIRGDIPYFVEPPEEDGTD
jgi:nuclear GTP-binding protein